jgi:hypothetical protein
LGVSPGDAVVIVLRPPDKYSTAIAAQATVAKTTAEAVQVTFPDDPARSGWFYTRIGVSLTWPESCAFRA